MGNISCRGNAVQSVIAPATNPGVNTHLYTAPAKKNNKKNERSKLNMKKVTVSTLTWSCVQASDHLVDKNRQWTVRFHYTALELVMQESCISLSL